MSANDVEGKHVPCSLFQDDRYSSLAFYLWTWSYSAISSNLILRPENFEGWSSRRRAERSIIEEDDLRLLLCCILVTDETGQTSFTHHDGRLEILSSSEIRVGNRIPID